MTDCEICHGEGEDEADGLVFDQRAGRGYFSEEQVNIEEKEEENVTNS